MKIFYPGVPGAYSHIAAEKAAEILWWVEDFVGVIHFDRVRQSIDKHNIGVLPIENSYAGTIHANIYSFLKYQYRIVGEVSVEVDHCLLSKEKKLSDVDVAYSHRQALAQCEKFLSKNHIASESYEDTASAAKMLSEGDLPHAAAIASRRAGELYGLNILAEHIQDQVENTTRFFVIAHPKSQVEFSQKLGKVAILFAAKNKPGILYKCLWALSTYGIDLTKIESLPSHKDAFDYMFRVETKADIMSGNMKLALEELDFFTSELHVLGVY